MTRILAVSLAACIAATGTSALAESRVPSHCIAIAGAAPGMIWQAKWGDPLPAGTVRLSYVGHSTFLIETPGGLSVATDYTGRLGPGDAALCVRFHDIRLLAAAPAPGTENIAPVGIERRVFLGASRDYFASLADGTALRITTPPELDLQPGTKAWIHMPPEKCRGLDR